MDLAGTSFDTEEREAYYFEANKILCEDVVAVIPIMGYERNELAQSPGGDVQTSEV